MSSSASSSRCFSSVFIFVFVIGSTSWYIVSIGVSIVSSTYFRAIFRICCGGNGFKCIFICFWSCIVIAVGISCLVAASAVFISVVVSWSFSMGFWAVASYIMCIVDAPSM